MEPEGLLSYSLDTTTCLYPEPDKSTAYFFITHFNIMPRSMPRFSKCLSSLQVPATKILYAFLVSPMNAACSADVIYFDLTTLVISNYETPKCVIFFHLYFTSSLAGLNFLFRIVFWNTLMRGCMFQSHSKQQIHRTDYYYYYYCCCQLLAST
jgi:hypothetical protein